MIKNIIKTIKITILIIIIIFIYARFIEPNLLIVKTVDINSTTNVDTNNIKIVLFSDTHFGEFYVEEKLENIVNKINDQDADIVIFGGDLMDSYYRSPPDIDYIKTYFKKIESKIGNYSVYGNHDYGGGAVKVYKNIMEGSGFTLLKNEIKTIDIDDVKINIIGLDDYLLGKPDKNILNGIEKNHYNILVSHAPDLVDELNFDDINLVLSGHTHGGQVNIPFITEKVLPLGGKKYIKGIFDFDNDIKTKLYVTSGIGLTKINFRFLNIPEIITLNVKI